MPPDGTTGETTSHLTKLQTAQQVIGYSHLTKAASCQVIGYRNDGGGCHRERSAAIQRGGGHARDCFLFVGSTRKEYAVVVRG